MFNKIFLTILLGFLSSFAFAQPHIEQKTLLINSQDKSKVRAFQEQVRIKIKNHRLEMHSKKKILETEKNALINDVKNARNANNGKLTEDQKSEFKKRRDILENQILQLNAENSEFMQQIDKEREMFFSSLKRQK